MLYSTVLIDSSGCRHAGVSVSEVQVACTRFSELLEYLRTDVFHANKYLPQSVIIPLRCLIISKYYFTPLLSLVSIIPLCKSRLMSQCFAAASPTVVLCPTNTNNQIQHQACSVQMQTEIELVLSKLFIENKYKYIFTPRVPNESYAHR